MPDVRYVCLTDLHLGAQNSLLTELLPGTVTVDKHQPSAVLTQMLACLASLVERNEDRQRPTLILAGDILELALANDDEAGTVFTMFVQRALGPDGFFDDLVYFVPGNHDHHVWEAARERQYTEYVGSRSLDDDLEAPWHTTRMRTELDPQPVRADVLTALIRRALGHDTSVTVRAVYPNLALSTPEQDRHLFVHHGHFVEPLYTLMSTLREMIFPDQHRPLTDLHVWDWENENFAWIDFFWSTLGRSASVGDDLGLLYASLQSTDAMKTLGHNLALGLVAKTRGPRVLKRAEAYVLARVLNRAISKGKGLERSQGEVELSPRAEAGLRTYVEHPLRDQIVREFGAVPARSTFVFGHTHKPFQRHQPFAGFSGGMDVYNTGGWVVDSVETRPLHGAAAILLDERLHAASLTFYRQRSSAADYRVAVAQADDTEENPLVERLASLIDAESEPWHTFSATVATAVAERYGTIRSIIRGGS